MSDTQPSLLIVGASVRAAAQSAVRGGMRVVAVDQFADLDCAAVAEKTAVFPRFEDIPALCQQFPAMPWMYVGGMENQPAVVEQLSKARTLWGNGPEVLRQIRDPWQLERIALPTRMPAMKSTLSAEDAPQAWLWKGYASSAGLQVASANEAHRAWPGYYQRKEAGIPHSAAFISEGERCHMLGVTEQLVGHEWFAPRSFQYAGNIGPVKVAAAVANELEELGQRLTVSCQLRGLWGVDFLLNDSQLWLLEVNPRYCASHELFDRACGLSLVELHSAACQRKELWHVPSGRARLPEVHLKQGDAPARLQGKLIVYAQQPGTISANLIAAVQAANEATAHPRFADISPAETEFPAGGPLLTLFAHGETPAVVRQRLVSAREKFLLLLRDSA